MSDENKSGIRIRLVHGEPLSEAVVLSGEFKGQTFGRARSASLSENDRRALIEDGAIFDFEHNV